MSHFASVQARHLRLADIADDVVCLGPGQYRAILEVGGVPFGLLGDSEQEALLAGYAGWLNSLAYPVQVLVRVVPFDLEGYLGALQRRARGQLPAALARLAHDHVALLQHLAAERLLLERRHYVVVPAGDGAGRPRRRWPFRRPPADLAAAPARQQLTARCEEVARGLGRCGLAVRRLGSVELAQLFHACWCPERSRFQRLRAELVAAAAATKVAVRPERSV